MLYQNNHSILDTKYSRLPEIINVPISLSKSLEGRYFVGQTENLWVGKGSNAWALLFNPPKSCVDLFVNVITISNFSNQQVTAEIWMNAKLPELGTISDKVSPANIAQFSDFDSKVQIRYVQTTEDAPEGGVNIFDRIVPPNGTLVSEEDGKFIIPPCGNYTIFLKSSSFELSKVIVAFGWWEDNRVK